VCYASTKTNYTRERMRERERERIFVCTALMVLGVVFNFFDSLITGCLFSHLCSTVAVGMLVYFLENVVFIIILCLTY
jgi:hypothetical protein